MRSAFAVIGLCALLLGCASIQNAPVNQPGSSADLVGQLRENFEERVATDDSLVVLSFSGGGTRAAAFSFGVLEELARTPVRGGGASMIDRIDFISGVSGGSVTAAYFGLRKRDAMADFREKFLLRNAEEGLQTDLNLATLGRAFAGGINDSSGLPRWLDANLFHGATFADLRRTVRPRVWINASDIYNRTPFVFGATAFGAMCSDLASYPLANAVAASAAVPVAFAPVVIQTFPGRCKDPLPDWIVKARDNRNAPPMLSAFAKAISRYHDGEIPYIKLLDGGLVDNYGLSGFTISLLSARAPYEPLSPEQAVKIRRGLVVVVDARTGLSGNWINIIEGPSGADLVKAAADTAIDASVGAGFTAFERTMGDWQASLIRWRCGLSAAERARYGARPGWNCHDLKFFVGRVGFDQLDPARAARLETVPTRFRLPPQQVDEVIAADRDALRASSAFRMFAGRM